MLEGVVVIYDSSNVLAGIYISGGVVILQTSSNFWVIACSFFSVSCVCFLMVVFIFQLVDIVVNQADHAPASSPVDIIGI